MIQRKPDDLLPPIDVSDYGGRWIVLNPKTNEVLADGDSPTSAIESMPSHDIEPLLYFVPTSDALFVGHGA